MAAGTPYSSEVDALQTGVSTSHWGKGDGSTGANREDLSDVMTIVDPTDTPGLARFGDTDASAIIHQWTEKTLKDPKAGQTQAGDSDKTSLVGGVPEGAQFNATARPVPTRGKNYLQIFMEQFEMTRTQMQVATAGRGSGRAKFSAEVREAIKETMRAIEARFWSVLFPGGFDGAAPSYSGGSPVQRLAATAEGLIGMTTTSKVGTSSEGNITTLGTPGTVAGAVTEDDILDAIMDQMDDSGDPLRHIFVHHRMKRKLARILTGVGGAGSEAPLNRSTAVGTIPAVVRRYESESGELEIVGNRWVTREDEAAIFDTGSIDESSALNAGGLNQASAAGRIWLLATDLIKVAWLQKPVPVDIAKRGDAVSGMVVAECTYEVRAGAKAHACIKNVAN